jgi:hypothetical protein
MIFRMAVESDAPKISKVPEGPLPVSGSHLKDHILAQLKSNGRIRNVERIPDIDFHFYFGSHGDRLDAQNLCRFVTEKTKAHVLLLEDPSATEETIRIVQSAIRYGPDALGGRVPSKFFGGVISSLYDARSQVILGCADVRDASYLSERVNSATQILGRFSQAVRSRRAPYAEALARTNEAELAAASAQKAREQFWLTTVGSELVRILEENPELLHQPKLTVVASMGSDHQGLYTALQQRHPATSKELSGSYPESFRAGLLRRGYLMNESYRPSREDIENALIGQIITLHYLSPQVQTKLPSRDFYLYLDAIVGSFKPGQKEQYYNLCKDSHIKSVTFLNDILIDAGVPPVDRGLDAILQYTLKLDHPELSSQK